MKKRPSRPRKSHTVPVASRDAERAQRAAERAQRSRTRRARVFPKQDMASVVILISVVLLVLLAIAAPLRNYYEGRAEIARAQESIERLEARKQALESDIAMYEDDAFMRQEARRRLGVVEEGETVWRILDPRMSAPTTSPLPPTRFLTTASGPRCCGIPSATSPRQRLPSLPKPMRLSKIHRNPTPRNRRRQKPRHPNTVHRWSKSRAHLAWIQ